MLAVLMAGIVVVGGIVLMQGKKESIAPVSPVIDEQQTTSTPVVEEDTQKQSPQDGVYTVVPVESKAEWAGSKKLIAEWIDTGTIAIKEGEFTVVSSTVTGTVVFDMTSIQVTGTGKGAEGNPLLEKHLKSADFFEVETYPTAVFAPALCFLPSCFM